MARIACKSCNGDGRSRDPFWKQCWTCCGRGDLPTDPADVLASDFGNGIGFTVEYTRDRMARKRLWLSGLPTMHLVSDLPPKEPERLPRWNGSEWPNVFAHWKRNAFRKLSPAQFLDAVNDDLPF